MSASTHISGDARDSHSTMFKRNPQTKSSANIKSSERRLLLAEICEFFDVNKDKLSKEDELALVPATIKQASYQTELDKGTIYFGTDEKPLWFRARGFPLLPTVYTLWRAGYLVPLVRTNPHVIDRIQNGANLMLPGCIPPFDSMATKDALVGIVDYRLPTVVRAIGVCGLDLSQYTDVQGLTGTAVQVLHHFEDGLYSLYEGDVEVPTEVDTVRHFAIDREEETTDVLLEHEQPEQSEPDKVDELAETVSELSVEDMDNFFIRAFLQSVKNDKIELPLSASTFISEHVLKNFPRMDPKLCNIKKTSWKKTAKYLKALEKLKYLALKGKGDDVTITAIHPPKELVETFVPHKTMEDAKGSGYTPGKKELEAKLSVVSLYKPTSKVRPVLSSGLQEVHLYYTQAELKAILNDYFKAKELVDKKNGKLIKMDAALHSGTGLSDATVARDKIFPAFLKSFSPHYSILRPGEELSASTKVHKGEPKKVQILTKTVLGRKKTTGVLDFEQFFIKPQTLAEDLKNKCSGSTAIGSAKRDPSIVEVMVQGPHGPTIIEYLKLKGVPISYIEFEDKSKGKKKKA